LFLAESHLTRRLFGSMVQRISALPLPAGSTESVWQEDKIHQQGGTGRRGVCEIAWSEGVAEAEMAGEGRFGDLWAPILWSPNKTFQNRSRIKYTLAVLIAKKEIPT
jgi:hypothetical protein